MDERRVHNFEELDSPAQATLPGAFRLGYPLPRESWDEMFQQSGLPRPHAEAFCDFLGTLKSEEMRRRWDLGLRLIRENGVTYNVYSGNEGFDLPWQLDPLPLIINAEDWRGIELALVQRATLLNQILADLYGPQDLLARGLIPASLILSHPGYLRPVKDVRPPGGTFLHLYAADIARTPDGHWQVVSDRCEAPAGAGYALENRSIIGRLLADALRNHTIRSLTPFFQRLRDSLLELSPRSRETPRIVLLTPGPYNATYFEHAYLARQLGYTLVEGEDLTMRDGRVWLKTLEGLQQIDVILRRTTGPFCDPLELRSDSMLGVAGLAKAVRSGSVVVANALGSGVIEGGLLSPFLPALSRHLLGEELKMESVPSWWCGDPVSQSLVMADFDQLVIKSTLPQPAKSSTHYCARLSEPARQELRARIGDRPRDFIAQAQIRLSTTPVWNDEGLDPRPMMLRVFLVAAGDGYMAMPGGLVRVAGEPGGSRVSLQAGGGSKDAWVQADDAEHGALIGRGGVQPVRLVRGARDLPSRVADNLFWFGRYLERVDDTTRMVRAALARAGSTAAFGAAEELPIALSLLGKLFKTPKTASDDERLFRILEMAFGPSHSDGLCYTVERIHRMASLARDRLSPDTWRAVNHLQQAVQSIEGGERLMLDEALTVLNTMILASEALNGLVMENMTRGLAWRFVDVGRRLERSIHMLDLLSGVVLGGNAPGGAALELLLEISDSSMTYRSRYLSAPQFAPVWDLLLVDESNPRSLGFQLAALAEHMEKLAAHRRAAFLGPEQRLTVWLTGAVRTAEIERLCTTDEDGEVRTLSRFMEALRSKLWELSEEVTKKYFTHSTGHSTIIRPGAESWS